MQQYKWVAGSDTAGSPVFEVLAEGEPKDVEQLVSATGMSKEEVAAHINYGVTNGLVKQLAAAKVGEPTGPVVPTPKTEELDMTAYLLGGKRTNAEDEDTARRML